MFQMSSLIAIDVISGHYDASHADQPAFLKLLNSLEISDIKLRMEDGRISSLGEYLVGWAGNREVVVDLDSMYENDVRRMSHVLLQVAVMVVLADARGVADVVGRASVAELHKACERLEKLLNAMDDLFMFRTTTRDRVNEFVSVSRTLVRLPSLSLGPCFQSPYPRSASNGLSAPLLSSINARLRVCDIATQVLAASVRSSLHDKSTCVAAVNLSLRLLALCCNLPQDYSGQNLLHPALIAGASHVGFIVVYHLDIDPFAWLDFASKLLIPAQTGSRHISPEPSLLIAMFGGMVKLAYAYVDAKLDDTSTTRAATALSMLLFLFEKFEPSFAPACAIHTEKRDGNNAICKDRMVAMEFMGERVIPVEEENDHGSLTHTSILTACDEFVRRSGTLPSVLELVTALLSAAADQYLAESVADAERVRPVSVSGVDEADDHFADVTVAQSLHHFSVSDMFDAQSPSILMPSSTEQPQADPKSPRLEENKFLQRVESHYEVAALCFEILRMLLKATVISDGKPHTCLLSRDALLVSIERAAESVAKFTSRTPERMLTESVGIVLGMLPDEARFSSPDSCVVRNAESGPRAILHNRMLDFGISVGDWLGSCVDTEGASRLASILGSAACPVDFVASILQHVTKEVAGSAIVEAFAFRLLRSHDRTDICVQLTSQQENAAFVSAMLYVESHIEMGTAQSALCVILNCIEESCSYQDGNLGLDVRRFTFIFLMMSYMLRLSTSGRRDAVFYLRTSLRASDEASQATGNIIEWLHRLRSLMSCSMSSNRYVERLGPTCARISRMIDTVAENIVDCLWSEIVNGERTGGKPQGTENILGCATGVDGNSNGILALLDVYVCLKSAYDLSSHAHSICVDAGISSSAEGVRGSDVTDTVERTSFPRDCMFFDYIRSLQSFVDSKDEAIGESLNAGRISELFRHVGRNPEGLSLRDLVHLDWSILAAYSLLCCNVKYEFELPPASISTLFCDIRYCLEFHLSCRPESALATFADFSSPDRSAAINDECLRSILSFLKLAATGNTRHCLVQCLEHVGKLLTKLSERRCPWDSISFVAAGQLAMAVGQADCVLEIGLRDWMRSTARSVLDSSSFTSLDDFCSIVIGGCRAHCTIIEAAGSKNGLDNFIKMMDAERDFTDFCGLTYVLQEAELSLNGLDSSCSQLLSQVVPKASLDSVISSLMISRNDSAVCVESTASALATVSNICRNQELWCRAFCRALQNIVKRDHRHVRESSFFYILCKRSVLTSAIMSGAVTDFLLELAESAESTSRSQLREWLLKACETISHVLCSTVCDVPIEWFRRGLAFGVSMSILLQKIAAKMRQSGHELQDGHGTPVAEFASTLITLLDTVADCYGSEEMIQQCPDRTAKSILLVGLLNTYSCEVQGQRDVNSHDVVSSTFDGIFSYLCPGDDEIATSDSGTGVQGDDISSNACTFTTTGSQFVEQHWYFCYTCGLSGTEGVCTVCAQVCHAGHDLSYSRLSRFFCDCGAASSKPVAASAPVGHSSNISTGRSSRDRESQNGATIFEASRVRASNGPGMKPSRNKSCQCLKPRTKLLTRRRRTTIVENAHLLAKDNEDVWNSASQMLSGLRKTGWEENSDEICETLDEYNLEVWTSVKDVISSERFATCLVKVASGFLGLGMFKEKHSFYPMRDRNSHMSRLLPDENYQNFLLAIRVGKLESRCDNSKSSVKPSAERCEQAALLGSRMTFSLQDGLLAFIEMGGKICVLNISVNASENVGAHSTALPRLSEIDTLFAPTGIEFHPEHSRLLLAFNFKHVSILTLSDDGLPSTRLDLAVGFLEGTRTSENVADADSLSSCNTISSVKWIAGDAFLVLVVTRDFVKIFDVSEDVLSPAYFVPLSSLLSNSDVSDTNTLHIVDACVHMARDNEFKKPFAHLYSLLSNSELFETSLFCARRGPLGGNLVASFFLEGNAEKSSMPASVTVTAAPVFLCVACTNGYVQYMPLPSLPFSSMCGPRQVSSSSLQTHAVSEGTSICLTPFPAIPGCILYSCLGKNIDYCGVIDFTGENDVVFSPFNTDITCRIVGICGVPPSLRFGYPRQPAVLAFLDDGSLWFLRPSREQLGPQLSESDYGESICDMNGRDDIMREIDHEIFELEPGTGKYLQLRKSDKFLPNSVGFFENCRGISDEVTLAVHNVSLDGLPGRKEEMPLSACNRESFVGPCTQRTFHIVLRVHNKSLALVGLRLQVGATDKTRSQAPGRVRVFDRDVNWPTAEIDGKRWIDIPFAVSEYLRSPREVHLELEPRRMPDGSFYGDGSVAFDGLEAYGIKSSELNERRRAFEADINLYDRSLLARVERSRESRLAYHLLDLPKQLLPRNGSSLFESRDSIFATIVVCLNLVLTCSSPIPEHIAAELSIDVISHDLHIFAGAQRRYGDSGSIPCLEDTVLSLFANQCLLSSHASDKNSPTSRALSIASRSTYAMKVLNDAFAFQAQTEEFLHPFCVERILSLAAESSRFGFWLLPPSSCKLSAGMNRLQSLLRDASEALPNAKCLRMLAKSFLALRRSERRLLISLRDACSNLVDVLTVVMYARLVSVNSIASLGELPAHVDVLCISAANVLCEVLISLDEDVRLYAARRVVDLFEFSPAIMKKCVEEDDIWDLYKSSEIEEISTQEDRFEPDPPVVEKWIYKCDSCGEPCGIEWWHCVDCDDFDICSGCVDTPLTSFPRPHHDSHLIVGVTELSVALASCSDPTTDDGNIIYKHIFRMLVIHITSFMRSSIRGEGVSGLQLVEVMQLLQRLVTPPCRPAVIFSRLSVLFDRSNGFVDLLVSLFRSVDANDWGASSVILSVPSSMTRSPFATRFVRLEVSLLALYLLESLDDVSLARHLVRTELLTHMCSFLDDLSAIVQQDVAAYLKNLAPKNSQESEVCNAATFANCLPPIGSSPDIPLRLLLSDTSDSIPVGIKCLIPSNGRLGLVPPGILAVAKVLRIMGRILKSITGQYLEKQLEFVSRECICAYAHVTELIDIGNRSTLSLEEGELKKFFDPIFEVQESARAVLLILCGNSRTRLQVELGLIVVNRRFEEFRDILMTNNCHVRDGNIDWNLELSRAVSVLHGIVKRHCNIWRVFLRNRHVPAASLVNSYSDTTSSVLECLFLAISETGGETHAKILEILGIGIDKHADTLLCEIDGKLAKGELRCTNRLEPDRERRDLLNTVVPEETTTSDRNDPVISFFVSNAVLKLEKIIEDLNSKDHIRPIRRAAGIFMQSLLHVLNRSQNTAALNIVGNVLLQRVSALSVTGTCGEEMVDVLGMAVETARRTSDDILQFPWLLQLCSTLIDLVRRSSDLLSSHPNAHIYKALSSFMVVDGYFLESEPCLPCCGLIDEDASKATFRLDSLKAESKFTHKAIYCRLKTPQSVSGVFLKISEPNQLRLAKLVNIFRSVRPVADAAELKSKDHSWVKLTGLGIGIDQTDVGVYLDNSVIVANIMFEFAEFHGEVSHGAQRLYTAVEQTSHGSERGSSAIPLRESDQLSESSMGNDRLQCPRCSRQVTDRYGICRSCGENSFQCRACRNIMYEVLDGFLCNECGYCKHGRFDFSLLCTPSFAAESVHGEGDRKRAAAIIEREADTIHKKFEQLKSLRTRLVQILSYSAGDETLVCESGDHPAGHASPGTQAGTESVGLLDLSGMESILRTLIGDDNAPHISRSLNLGSRPIPGIVDSALSVDASMSPEHRRGVVNDAFRDGDSDLSADQRSKARVQKGFQISRAASAAASIYGRECKSVFAEMVCSIRILTSTRQELCRYAACSGSSSSTNLWKASKNGREKMESTELKKDRTDGTAFDCTNCFGCTQAFLRLSLPLLEMTLKYHNNGCRSLAQSDFAVLLLRCASLLDSETAQEAARRVITMLVRNNPETTAIVCAEIRRKVEFCIQSFQSVNSASLAHIELAVLQDTLYVDDDCWEERLRTVLSLLFHATHVSLESPAIAEQIVMPCIQAAANILSVSSHQSKSLRSLASCESRSGESIDDDEIDETAGSADSRYVGVVPPHATEDGFINTFSDAGSDLCHSVAENSRIADENDNLPASPSPSDFASVSIEPPSEIDYNVPSERDEVHHKLQICTSVLEAQHESNENCRLFDCWARKQFSFAEWKNNIVSCRTKGTQEALKLRDAGLTSEESECLLATCFKRWRESIKPTPQNELFERIERPCTEIPLGLVGVDMSWAFRLILFSPSSSVRAETCRWLETLCGREEVLELRLLDSLIGKPLDDARTVGAMSCEYFNLIERLISHPRTRLYLISRGFLAQLSHLVELEAARLEEIEENMMQYSSQLNLFHGFVLKRQLDILQSLLESLSGKSIQVRRSAYDKNESQVIGSSLQAYLTIHKIVLLRSKLVDDCLSSICEILASPSYLFLPPSGEMVVAACVDELRKAHENRNIPMVAALLDLMCKMLCPVKDEPVYHLILQKAATQEEYIRGSMTRHTYPSTEFEGPLMRDVKRKICQDLDLTSLLEDDLGDFGLELLVAGNVIKLDLPITAVYEHVWRRSAEAATSGSAGLSRRSHPLRRGPASDVGSVHRQQAANTASSASLRDSPMVVIYRLSGLDGEATEPIIESLPGTEENFGEPEEEYKSMKVLGDVSGLPVLISLLSVVGSWGGDSDVALREPALRLLRSSCEIAANRARIAALPCSVGTLIDCAASALDRCHESPAAVESAESLSIAIEKILSERALSGHILASDYNDPTQLGKTSDFVVSRLQVFLEHLKVVSSPKAESALLRLLPYLIQGSASALEVAMSHFEIDWDSIDDNIEYQRAGRQLAIVLSAAPLNRQSLSIYQLLLKHGIVDQILAYLQGRFPYPRIENSNVWNVSLELVGPPICLNVLKGFANAVSCEYGGYEIAAHLRQVFANPVTVPALCQIEMSVSSTSVGSAAEELVEALQRDDELRYAVLAERNKIRAARRAAAEASRAAIIAPSRGQRSNWMPTSDVGPGIGLVMDLPDEVGPACVVCGDGFTSRPDDAMSIYVLSRRVCADDVLDTRAVDDARCDYNSDSCAKSIYSSLSRLAELLTQADTVSSQTSSRPRQLSCSIFGFTNVTHFNLIHLGCHREAARSDRSLRPPRDEWEGASLRNSQTKCNNLFPVKPPSCFPIRANGECDHQAEKSKVKLAEATFEAAVDFYFGRLSSLGRTSMSRLVLVICDIAQSLERFARGIPSLFSEHSHGGGPHSNVCVLPHMMQLAWHIMDRTNCSAQCRNALRDLLDSFWGRAGEDSEEVPVCLAVALLISDISEWNRAIPKLVRKCIRNNSCCQSDRQLELDVMCRLIAFADLLNRKLKVSESTRPEHWRKLSMETIARNEEWLSNQCINITSIWDVSIRRICDGQDLRTYLEEVLPGEVMFDIRRS